VRAYAVPASSLRARDKRTDFNISASPHDADVIVYGNSTIKITGPEAKDLIATILAHLNGAPHADPR
jgi:hypothetical protein